MINDNCVCAPFKLAPAGKDYLWGGTRLRDDFGKSLPHDPLAETWECSTHPDGYCTVNGGMFDGETLESVLEKHPEMIGTHPLRGTKEMGILPVLIKFIDAKQDLSVQVHPTDEYAAAYEGGQLGKTEMWYVCDALPGATLVHGLRRSMEPEEMRSRIEDGTIEKYLNRIPVRKGDVFFMPAGTIHAIGAGALIAEIQENSNLTYRLYDYHRKGKDGKERPLHVEKGLEVANLLAAGTIRQPMRTLKYKKGYASELLGRCKYFQTERVLLNSDEGVPVQTGTMTFEVLLCIGGEGRLSDLKFAKGDCIFIPASSEGLKLFGQAEILRISC